MESVQKTWDSVWEHFRDRLRNPFVAAFAISWLFINWESLAYFLLSDVSVEHRLFHVKHDYRNFLNSVAYPFLFATIYVIGIPYLTWGLEWCTEKATDARIMRMGRKKAVQIRSKAAEVKEQVILDRLKEEQQNLHDSQRQIDRLKEQNDSLRKELEQADENHRKAIEQFQDENVGARSQLRELEVKLMAANKTINDQRDAVNRLFVEPSDIHIQPFYDGQKQMYGFRMVGSNNRQLYMTNSRWYPTIEEAIDDMRTIKASRNVRNILQSQDEGQRFFFIMRDPTDTSKYLATSPTYSTSDMRDQVLQQLRKAILNLAVVNLTGQHIKD